MKLVISIFLVLLLVGCTVNPDTPPPEGYLESGNGVFISEESYYEEEEDEYEEGD